MRIFQQYRLSRFFLLFLVGFALCRPAAGADSGPDFAASNTFQQVRPVKWAIPLSLNGLPNLFKVNDGFYRGAQPTADGMKELKKIGVKTVVNLRAFHDDADMLKDTGLGYERIEFNTWHPEVEDIVRFLSLVTDSNKAPVFVHCQHGADRTGTMCAVYRIVVCGWSKDEAIKEMTGGGYGFHSVWANLISFIRNLDIDGIKKKLPHRS